MSKVTDAIHNHHQKILRELTERSAAVEKDASKPNAEALAEFLKSELLPHASGEEAHLYPLVGQLVKTHGDGTETMRVDHDFIHTYTDKIDAIARELATAKPAQRASLAERIRRLAIELQAVVQLHLEKEERVYLPLLERRASLEHQEKALEQMHGEYREQKERATTHAAHAARAAGR